MKFGSYHMSHVAPFFLICFSLFEELVKDLGPEMEAILQSFRLGI